MRNKKDTSYNFVGLILKLYNVLKVTNIGMTVQ